MSNKYFDFNEFYKLIVNYMDKTGETNILSVLLTLLFYGNEIQEIDKPKQPPVFIYPH